MAHDNDVALMSVEKCITATALMLINGDFLPFITSDRKQIDIAQSLFFLPVSRSLQAKSRRQQLSRC